MSEPIGAYLKRERELRKISLEEISRQTKIRLEHLRAIESGHFEKLPGFTFAKGYLKSYSQHIGLIPEEVLLRFEDYLTQLTGPSLPPPSAPSVSRFLWPLAVLLLGTLGITLFLWLKK